MPINKKAFLADIKRRIYAGPPGSVLTRNVASALRSKVKSKSINRKFRSKLMSKINTSDVGEKNYNTIRRKVSSYLKAGNARAARVYIDSQIKKIAAQKKTLLNK